MISRQYDLAGADAVAIKVVMAVQGRICVYLLAENRLLREALAKVLNKKNDIDVVGTASFSPLVVEQICASQPDVLLCDSAAIAFSDAESIPVVRELIPRLKVVLIGMDADAQTFLRAVRSGVVGYLLKDASAMEVAAAVRSVARDEAVCPPALCLLLFEFAARRWREMPDVPVIDNAGLTRRERQLTQMIGQGLTNKEIAAQLNLSEQTVKNHAHGILRKTGAGNRLAVAELYRAAKLVA